MIDFHDATKPDDGPVVTQDEPESYIVLIGDLSFGFRTVGPFDDFEEAASWARDTIGDTELTWVMNVFDPNSSQAVKK